MLNLKIKNSVPVQKDFMGNGAVYHGYAGMPDNAGRVYSDELCEIEASRAADMKLKIARTFYSWWAWDEKNQVWNWETETMKAFYAWLKRMQAANITVALNAAWNCPEDINDTSWVGKSPFNVPNDWKQSVQNYADWVSESLHQLVEVRGFTNIKILVMFTEPNHGFGKVEFYKLWAEAVEAVHNTLIRDGRRDTVKLMGSNEGSGVTAEMLKWVSENESVKDIIDIYSSHTYQTVAAIPKKYIKTGKTAVTMSLAGGRFRRTIPLKPNTDYVASTDVLFRKTNPEPAKGHIHFGVYVDDGRNDIHVAVGNGPSEPVAKGSTYSITPSELGEEYNRFTVKFNSGDATSGVIGVFYDMFSPGLGVVDNITLCEAENDESIVPNGNFENDYDGWTLYYAGGLKDAYNEWYNWAKKGLQYANGKPFCFDEYDALYDRDHSRPSHGAEIVTAAVALMNAGVQSSLMWSLFDQQWPNNHTYNGDAFYDGDHRCGVMPVLTRTLIPHRSYYAFTLLSRYTDGNGSKVYEGIGNDCLHTTMCVSPEGDTTIVVVNCKDIPDSFEVSFEQEVSLCLNRHTFNPDTCVPTEKPEVIGIDKVFENVTTSIKDTIEPYSVIVYTTYKD